MALRSWFAATMPPLPDASWDHAWGHASLAAPFLSLALPALVLVLLALSVWLGVKGGAAFLFTTTISSFRTRSLVKQLKGKTVAYEVGAQPGQ